MCCFSVPLSGTYFRRHPLRGCRKHRVYPASHQGRLSRSRPGMRELPSRCPTRRVPVLRGWSFYSPMPFLTSRHLSDHRTLKLGACRRSPALFHQLTADQTVPPLRGVWFHKTIESLARLGAFGLTTYSSLARPSEPHRFPVCSPLVVLAFVGLV